MLVRCRQMDQQLVGGRSGSSQGIVKPPSASLQVSHTRTHSFIHGCTAGVEGQS